MEEARIKCLVHGSSLRGDLPLVMVTTSSREAVIHPPREVLTVEDKIHGSRVFTCHVLGRILEDKGTTLVVKVQSGRGERELEVPVEEVSST